MNKWFGHNHKMSLVDTLPHPTFYFKLSVFNWPNGHCKFQDELLAEMFFKSAVSLEKIVLVIFFEFLSVHLCSVCTITL